MKITLPLPPNLGNARMHWRVKHQKRKAYFEACGIMLAPFMLYFPDDPPTTRTRLKATIYCGGRMDQDNAIARLKWPVDWMVKNDILAEDSPAFLEWAWPIEQVVKRKQEYRVEFELEAA